MRRTAALLTILTILMPASAAAKGGHSGGHGHSTGSHHIAGSRRSKGAGRMTAKGDKVVRFPSGAIVIIGQPRRGTARLPRGKAHPLALINVLVRPQIL